MEMKGIVSFRIITLLPILPFPFNIKSGFLQKMYGIYNTLEWKFKMRFDPSLSVTYQSSIFLIVEITIPPREQIIKNAPRAISFHPPLYYFSVAAKQYLEDASLGGFSICLLVGKKGGGGGGGGPRGRKEVSSSIGAERKERRDAHGAFSTSPKGNYWQSARKWRRKYHVGGAPPRSTRSFLFADLNPLLPYYQAPPSCAASSRLILLCFLRAFPSRLCLSTINSTRSFFCAVPIVLYISFISRWYIVLLWKWSGWKSLKCRLIWWKDEGSWNV